MNATVARRVGDVASGFSRTVDWFASWFDSPHYRQLYAHRDSEEAARLIDRLIERDLLVPGSTVLDLGCGTGRHSRQLACRGFDVTGIDLSAESLRLARASECSNLRFLRQDMRLPFRARPFDHILNLFTSFGYFDDPSDHMAVVHNIASALRPGGTLVLDYLNVRYAEAHLVAGEVVERPEVAFRITRWSDADHIFKRIVADAPGAAPVEHVEKVAKFTLEDFQFMFGLYDMTIDAVFGDYSLAAFDEEMSPRLIVVATALVKSPPLRNGGRGGFQTPFSVGPAKAGRYSFVRDRFLRMRLTVSGVTPRYDASMDCGTLRAMDG